MINFIKTSTWVFLKHKTSLQEQTQEKKKEQI